ncbi:MAG TPA: flagellar basal body L-ring protein FlgH [Vicinamibacterales bacterium]|nr:flagellar basal body L-ring protein FlgH [Vicinamibacterales bacterium]
MNEHFKAVWAGVACAACLTLAVPSPAWAQKKQKPVPAPDSQDMALAAYLAAARQAPPVEASAWMNGLTMDLRVRKVNDIVTVRVLESISAAGSADSSLAKSSNSGVGIGSFFGLQNKIPAGVGLGNLGSSQSDTGFSGSGTTARASVLNATISARVAEVLPNGDLLVEGVREIEINGDRQVVVLTGVARAADVGPGNVVLSTALGQLRISYFGRGLTKGSLSPGWLLRILNKVF